MWISSGTLLAMASKAKSVKKDVRLYSKMDKTARVKATKKAVGSKLIFENRALLGKDFKMLIVCGWYRYYIFYSTWYLMKFVMSTLCHCRSKSVSYLRLACHGKTVEEAIRLTVDGQRYRLPDLRYDMKVRI